MDSETLAALQDFKRRLKARFGDKLNSVYLFGSRARGDHRPDSDADVAVVLNEKVEGVQTYLHELSDDATAVLIERDLYIQPWPLEAGALENPDAFWAASISNAVLREGVAI
jgi:predicted nucleotidyltransferase